MTYGTRGTLRPTKSASDYELEDLDRELKIVGILGAIAITIFTAGLIAWLVLA